MASRALNLMVGASLKIEPVKGGACYLVELIGYTTDKSLIVTPAYGEEGLVLNEGDELAVRYLGSDHSYAFYSKVIQVCDKPYSYLHLAYPQGVQGLVTRRAPRIPLQELDPEQVMRLNINDGSRQLSVTMADISTRGARLIANSRLGKCGERFIIELPSVRATNSELLELPCIIRHIHEQFDCEDGNESVAYHHGVEFDHLEEAAQLFIARFIKDSINRASVR